MGLIIQFYLCSHPRISASKTKPLCSILSSKGYSQHPYPIFIHSLTIQLAFLPLLCYCCTHWSIDSRSLDYTLARPLSLWDPALIFINVSHPAILFAICGSIQQSYWFNPLILNSYLCIFCSALREILALPVYCGDGEDMQIEAHQDCTFCSSSQPRCSYVKYEQEFWKQLYKLPEQNNVATQTASWSSAWVWASQFPAPLVLSAVPSSQVPFSFSWCQHMWGELQALQLDHRGYTQPYSCL